jgi:hypothetical protein
MGYEPLDGGLITKKSKPLDTSYFISDLYPNLQEHYEAMLPDDGPKFLKKLSRAPIKPWQIRPRSFDVAIDEKNDIRYSFTKSEGRGKPQYFLIDMAKESEWRKRWRADLKREAQEMREEQLKDCGYIQNYF